LDLSFVYGLARPYYAAGGRPSIDPIVFFKLQLVMFFDGIRSERQLVRHAADHLGVRWYLGYELHERLPHHSSLTRIRDRYGIAVFRQFFAAIVQQCIAAGLVAGRALYLDSTPVEANADFDSLHPRWFVDAHLAARFPAAQQEEVAAPTLPPPVRTDRFPTTDAAHAATNAARHDWIAACGQQHRAHGNRRYTRRADTQASTTDPDATVLPHRVGHPLGYHTHYVVDNGNARTILAVLVTPAEVQDNQPMLDLVLHTRFRWHLNLQHVTGDTKYGTVENIVALEQAGIQAYVPIADVGARPGMLAKRQFVYDPIQDVYHCPQGTRLQRRGQMTAEHTFSYCAPAKTCNACPIKASCTTSRRGRKLQRHVDEAYVDRVRAYHQTAAYQRAIRKRQVWVEPLFAEAKQWHGLRRFRLRCLAKVNMEALFIAAGQNIKRLIKCRQHRVAPCPALHWAGVQRAA
jgi:transposase